MDFKEEFDENCVILTANEFQQYQKLADEYTATKEELDRLLEYQERIQQVEQEVDEAHAKVNNALEPIYASLNLCMLIQRAAKRRLKSIKLELPPDHRGVLELLKIGGRVTAAGRLNFDLVSDEALRELKGKLEVEQDFLWRFIEG